MTSPRARAADAFRARWGVEPDTLVRAPGRVNLIGEHTDYNDGFVLPCAIDLGTVVAAGRGGGAFVETIAVDQASECDRFALDAPIISVGGWRDYGRGMAAMLGQRTLVGARLAIASDVPPGAGLSSSAALEIAVGRALLEIAGQTIATDALAIAARRAENEFVGAACGIMDQLISARGVAGHALLIDCRSLACRAVAMPGDTAIVVVHSGVRHTHVGGEYNARRAQCAAAARHYGVAALRDLDLATLEAGAHALDPLIYHRARHVVTENARTLAASSALATGNLRTMGALMAASHASMRDDFAITVPAIDALVAIADDVLGGQGGARMTGGGFGGCIVALAPRVAVGALTDAVRTRYRTPDGDAPEIYVCAASAGVAVIS